MDRAGDKENPMNIFEALRADHGLQRELMDALIETQGSSDTRRETFARLKAELHGHAVMEEREFYAPLMQHDLTQEKARHGVAEHFQIDCLLKKLEEYDMRAPAWIQTARELKDKVEHHLDEEEHELFQVAGKVLDEAEKSALAERYRAGMSEHRSG
jgi:hypothetical protein